MHGWRQRFTRLVSTAIFLGLLWVLFKKMIVVTWISVPWWAFLLLLVVLFGFIETMVSRTFSGGRGTSTRRSKQSAGREPSDGEIPRGANLDEIRDRIRKFEADRKP